MEENKSKKSGGVSLVLVIAILVIALVVCITYIMKNNEQKLALNNSSSEQTINALKSEIESLKNTIEQQKNKANRELVNINDETSISAEGEIIERISNSDDVNKSIFISYVVNGNNKGELRIRNNSKLLYSKVLEEKIIDIVSIDYYFLRDVFILFANGKVGKISIEDIENKNYQINIVENINNVIRIQKLCFLNEGAGTDFVLVAVDANGKIHTLDNVSD